MGKIFTSGAVIDQRLIDAWEREVGNMQQLKLGMTLIQWFQFLGTAAHGLESSTLDDVGFANAELIIQQSIKLVFSRCPACLHLLDAIMRQARAQRVGAIVAPDADQGGWMLTYSGEKVHIFEPDPARIFIEDIAHSLSNLCRFGGHTGWFYSVAQHSVLVSRKCSPENALAGLLHDAAEAYLIDLPRPIKRHPRMSFYREIEARWNLAIASRFNLDNTAAAEIAAFDVLLLTTEARDLFETLPEGWQHWYANGCAGCAEQIVPLAPEDAELLFIEEYELLTEQRLARIEHVVAAQAAAEEAGKGGGHD